MSASQIEISTAEETELKFAQEFHLRRNAMEETVSEVWEFYRNDVTAIQKGMFFSELKKLTQQKAILQYGIDIEAKDSAIPFVHAPIKYNELFLLTEGTCCTHAADEKERGLLLHRFRSLRRFVERAVKDVHEDFQKTLVTTCTT